MIINYTQNVYETKINELDGYLTQLKTSMETLENYKSQLPDIWSDDRAKEYTTVLTTEIIAVKNAIERVNGLKILYKNIVDELSGSKIQVSGIVDAAKGAIQSLGIEGA